MYHDERSTRQQRHNTSSPLTSSTSTNEHRRILRRNVISSNNSQLDDLLSPSLPQRPVPLLGTRPSTKFQSPLMSPSQRWNPNQSQFHNRAHSAEPIQSPSPFVTNLHHYPNLSLSSSNDTSNIPNNIRAASYPRPPRTDNSYMDCNFQSNDRQPFRRIRQYNRPATFSYRPLSVRNKQRTIRPMFPQHPTAFEQISSSSIKERAPRAVYNATTASAKAAALASASPSKGVLVEPTDRGSSRRLKEECDDLAIINSNRSDREIIHLNSEASSSSSPSQSINLSSNTNKKHSRIMVKRKVIRGSSIFRQASEADIDEYLQLERNREMVRCSKTCINIPPVKQDNIPIIQEDNNESDREICANCAAALNGKRNTSKRGVRRVSSLLTKHLGLEGENDNTIDIQEMANMDEQKAISIFLSEIRRYRKEMYLSSQIRSPERISTATIRRKDSRKFSKKEKMINSKEYGKLHNMASVRRTFSADDPTLMRALLHQERILSTHSANHKKKEQNKQNERDTKNNLNTSIVNDARYSRERSRSDLIPQRKLNQVDVEETCRRYMGRFAVRTNSGKPRFSRLRSGDNSDDRHTNSPLDTNRQRSTLTPENDDDEYADDQVRVLTAIEPVDPTLHSQGGNIRRISSYHIGFAMHGFGSNWRRSQHRSSDGNEGRLLRRLRSLRRRGEDR